MNGNHGVGVIFIKSLNGEEAFACLSVPRNEFFIALEAESQGVTFSNLDMGELVPMNQLHWPPVGPTVLTTAWGARGSRSWSTWASRKLSGVVAAHRRA
jgi:hypothetical protein